MFFPIWQSFISSNTLATYSGFLEHCSDFLQSYKFYSSVLEITLAIFLWIILFMLQHLCKASSFEACKSSSLFFNKPVYHSSNCPQMTLLLIRIIYICMRKCRLKQQQKIYSPVCIAGHAWELLPWSSSLHWISNALSGTCVWGEQEIHSGCRYTHCSVEICPFL